MYSDFRVVLHYNGQELVLFRGDPSECINYIINLDDNNDLDEDFRIGLAYNCHDCDCCHE